MHIRLSIPILRKNRTTAPLPPPLLTIPPTMIGREMEYYRRNLDNTTVRKSYINNRSETMETGIPPRVFLPLTNCK